MTPPQSDLDRFYTAIDSLSNDIAAHKGTIHAAISNANRQSEAAQKTARLGILVGAASVLVAIGALTVGYSAKSTTDDIEASRKEVRVSSCVQANVTTKATREALVAGVAVLALPNPERSPEAQARLDSFVATYSKAVEAKLPYRDCTSAGITRYFEHPPADPNKEG